MVEFTESIREQKKNFKSNFKILQVSCFDVAFCLGDKINDKSESIPNESNFKVCLVETKNGEPHPDTGIPPSFLVIKCDMFGGKNPQLNVDMGRPTKVHFSLSRLNKLMHIKNKVGPKTG